MLSRLALIILLANGGFTLAQPPEPPVDELPADHQPAFSLRIANGTLSLRAKDTPLRAVLEVVATQTDIRVWISPNLPRVLLNLDFDALDFVRGLALVLDSTSYILTRAADSQNSSTSQVYVLSLADARRARPSAASAPDLLDESDGADEIPERNLPPGFAAAIRDARAALSEPRQAAIIAERARIEQRLQALLHEQPAIVLPAKHDDSGQPGLDKAIAPSGAPHP